MNRGNSGGVPANDPMLRLIQAEKKINELIHTNNLAHQEIAKLKGRVRTLEVECGLVNEGEDADDGE